MGGGFLRKKFEKKNLILPAAHGQLETTDPECLDMDSGHSPDIKCAYNLFPGFLYLVLYLIFVDLLEHSRKSPENI